MGYPDKKKWTASFAAAQVSRYALALGSILVALGLARIFLHFHLPQPFTAFALCAIAITFWYAGTGPGILAALLSALIRPFFFEPGVDIISHLLYDLVFLIFAVLMSYATRARDELELRVAERTSALTQANEDLRLEIAERARAEEKLRQTEAYLSEAQRLTRMGSWVWSVKGRDALHLSEEWYRIYGFDPQRGVPTWEERLHRIHPTDRDKWLTTIDQAVAEKSDYEVEFRILLPPGTVRYIYTVGHPVINASGELEQFVGSSMDVTERRRADQERDTLRQVHADLAHISRVTTMGELTASLAHEINQPIAAAVTDASTCLRWLTRDHPNLEEAREAASRMVKDATRAAEIISRIRLLFKKGTTDRTSVDVNEIIREMIILLDNELTRHSVSVRQELAEDIPRIIGDRVQLQQVMMNLILNSIDAMNEVNGARELAIKSQRAGNEEIMVSVIDTGVGLPGQGAEQIFDPFFTTKLHGTGMGLRISRSIVEAHGGRLWAANNSPRGASFHLTLPIKVEAHELLPSSSFSE